MLGIKSKLPVHSSRPLNCWSFYFRQGLGECVLCPAGLAWSNLDCTGRACSVRGHPPYFLPKLEGFSERALPSRRAGVDLQPSLSPLIHGLRAFSAVLVLPCLVFFNRLGAFQSVRDSLVPAGRALSPSLLRLTECAVEPFGIRGGRSGRLTPS